MKALPYLVASAVLIPLAGKAFHIDDSLFLTFAARIAAHPLQYPFPDGVVHANPPGQFYLLAALEWLFGEREIPLHLGQLPLTLAALWGMAWLAEEFGVTGWMAALLLACNACFLVSASTLMPDATMLGLLLPAIACLWSDARAPSPRKLASASVLFALAWTIKSSAVPVLILAVLVQLAKGNRRAVVPLAALSLAWFAWNALTRTHDPALLSYGAKLIGGQAAELGWRAFATLMGLALCSVLAILWLVLLPARGLRRLAELLGAVLICASLLHIAAAIPVALLGLGLLLLGRVRPPQGRLSMDGAFLALWAAGTLLIPVIYNSASPKFLNVALPPLLLLALRAAQPLHERRILAAAAAGLAAALLLSYADYRFANDFRDVVFEKLPAARAAAAPGRTAWVAAHKWGDFIYARKAGARFAELMWSPDESKGNPNGIAGLRPGDAILDLAWPGVILIPRAAQELVSEGFVEEPFPVRLMSQGAGYWGSGWGLFPFVFDAGPPIVWRLWRVREGRFSDGRGGLLPLLDDPGADWVPRRW